MKDPGDICFLPEDIDLAESLPAGDPRRAHARECPRCRALLAAWRSFHAGQAPEGADPQHATERLDACLRREILAAPQAATRPARRPEPSRPRRGRNLPAARRLPPWPVLGRPGRAILAAAAVVLVCAGLWLVVGGPDGGMDRTILRGASDAPGPLLRLEAPEWTADGGVRLRWRPVAGADAYEVLLQDGEASTLATIPSRAAGQELSAELLAALAEEPRPLLVQVAALAAGDRIALSRPFPLIPAD